MTEKINSDLTGNADPFKRRSRKKRDEDEKGLFSPQPVKPADDQFLPPPTVEERAARFVAIRREREPEYGKAVEECVRQARYGKEPGTMSATEVGQRMLKDMGLAPLPESGVELGDWEAKSALKEKLKQAGLKGEGARRKLSSLLGVEIQKWQEVTAAQAKLALRKWQEASHGGRNEQDEASGVRGVGGLLEEAQGEDPGGAAYPQ